MSVDARPLENIQPKFVVLAFKNTKPHVPGTTPRTGFPDIRVLFKNSYKIFRKVRIGKSKSVLLTLLNHALGSSISNPFCRQAA